MSFFRLIFELVEFLTEDRITSHLQLDLIERFLEKKRTEMEELVVDIRRAGSSLPISPSLTSLSRRTLIAA